MVENTPWIYPHRARTHWFRLTTLWSQLPKFCFFYFAADNLKLIYLDIKLAITCHIVTLHVFNYLLYLPSMNSLRCKLRFVRTSDTMLAARVAPGEGMTTSFFLLIFVFLSWPGRRHWLSCHKHLTACNLRIFSSVTVKFFGHRKNKVKFRNYLQHVNGPHPPHPPFRLHVAVLLIFSVTVSPIPSVFMPHYRP